MRYYITSHMKNGDKWVTIRDGFKQMNEVIKCIVKDKEVVRFIVEEKNIWKRYTEQSKGLTNIREKAILNLATIKV